MMFVKQPKTAHIGVISSMFRLAKPGVAEGMRKKKLLAGNPSEGAKEMGEAKEP